MDRILGTPPGAVNKVAPARLAIPPNVACFRHRPRYNQGPHEDLRCPVLLVLVSPLKRVAARLPQEIRENPPPTLAGFFVGPQRERKPDDDDQDGAEADGARDPRGSRDAGVRL